MLLFVVVTGLSRSCCFRRPAWLYALNVNGLCQSRACDYTALVRTPHNSPTIAFASDAFACCVFVAYGVCVVAHACILLLPSSSLLSSSSSSMGRLASSAQHHQGDDPKSSLGPVSMGKEQRVVCSGGLIAEVEAAVLLKLGLRPSQGLRSRCLGEPAIRHGCGLDHTRRLGSAQGIHSAAAHA